MNTSSCNRYTFRMTQKLNVLLFLTTTFSYSVSKELRDLRLLGMLPMTGNGWAGGGSCLPAIQMALEDINSRMDILTEYNLTYKWIDSQCTFGIPVFRMFEAFYKDPPYVMLLGDGCSVGSEATAQVSHLWNLTQFSYGSSSPILSDRKRFPNFYRIVEPDQKMNQARIALLNEFKWKKVATIHQALEFFSVVIDDFVQRIQETDISILSQEIFVNDPLNRINNLKMHDARVIMTSLYEDEARAILCAAYRIGLYGPKIVWVFAGWFSTTFWRVKLHDVECTVEEMEEAAEGAFLTGPIFKNPFEERGVADLTVSEFETRFYNHRSYNKKYKGTDFAAPQCYDHVWIAALALNCTDTILTNIEHPKSLDMFTYNDSDINAFIKDCMSKTNMTGLSGRIVLSSDVDPDRVIKLERIQGGERKVVAMYRQDRNPPYFDWFDGALVWKDGIVPRDSTLVIEEEQYIPIYIVVVMTSLAGFGVCLTLVFFSFNVFYRNNKFIKMSSPNINNILLFGCILCYCTVFFKTKEAYQAAVCKARIFSFSLGFTITFGALFSKTWRVYRIFTNKRLLKRAIKDYQLLIVLVGLVAVQLVVLILWETLSPHKTNKMFLQNEVYTLNNGVEVRPYVRMCESKYSKYFEWALYITHGILLTFGSFLAWETRKVKIEALNDSHEIGLCIYNVVILSAVGLTISLLLEGNEDLVYGVTTACLLIGTTLIEIVIFIPKIHAIRTKVDENMTAPSRSQPSDPNNSSDQCRTNNTLQ